MQDSLMASYEQPQDAVLTIEKKRIIAGRIP
jgi:hypothetical protein